MDAPPFTITPLAGLTATPKLLADLDAIFFEASGRSFSSATERDAFRERWLGRYLDTPGDTVLLALADDGALAGYLVGAFENPADAARFSDISYFRTDFRALCRRYPAHLHINLAPAWRSRGIGARLIEDFCRRAATAGVPGVHVVTGEGMRNVRFYVRCGFAERGSAQWNGRTVVFLGRELTEPGRANA